MGRAFLDFASRGVGPYPLAGLDYLLVSHLQAKVNGSPVSATFDAGRNTCTLAAAAAAGTTVRIQRTTPRRQEQRLTQFLSLPDGQAGLTAALLDQDYRQNMLLAGEGRDAADGLATPASGMQRAGASWEGDSLRVQTLADGAAPGDAVTLNQLNVVDTTTRDLPTSVLDNDDGLMVVAGEWDDKAPAGFRTALGLGGVALLNSGTGASQVPALAGNPPQYPAASGALIDLTSHPIQSTINLRARAIVCRVKRDAQPGNTVDPTVATWSQSAASRYGFSGATWASRVDLNNGTPEVNGDFSPGRFDLTAGTWRIQWVFKARQTAGAGNNTSFRITDNDDTSSQTVHYDLGVHRLIHQFSGTQLFYGIFVDQMVFKSASPFSLVFRWALTTTGANNDSDLILYFHKVSTST